MEFTELNLPQDLQRGLEDAGYKTCMPVQEQVFGPAFQGTDIYAQSQTGTGKTAAYLISIFQRLLTQDSLRHRKILVLAPTRELAAQIEAETKKLGKHLPFSSGAFFGGVSYGPQIDMLRDNVQFIIGTPGRIIDLVQQGKMLLREVGFLVIDEADRMFDMGFIDDLRKLIRYLPPAKERQTFLFSATLNVRVKNLAWEYMQENPAEIVIEPEHVTVDLVTQELFHVGSDEKFRVLLGLLKSYDPAAGIIFCNQKNMAEELDRRLKINGYDCEYMMGDLPQSKRLQIIERLKEGKLKILVATDVAARGLDVDGLDLVINYDIPLDAETYVHRIGRTARAGKAGRAVSLACEKFVYGLPAIEKYIDKKIPVSTLTEELLSVEDKSRGMRYSHRYDEGRKGPQNSRDRGRGGLDRSGDRSRGRDDRSRGRDDRSRNRDDKYRSGAKSHGTGGIQRSVSEATGRGLDHEDRPLRQGGGNQRPPRRDDRAGHDDRGTSGARGSGNRDQRGGGAAQGAGTAEGAQGEKLYSMSMDERMKLYREKYAAGEGSGNREGGKRGPRAEDGKKGSRQDVVRDDRNDARKGGGKAGNAKRGNDARGAARDGSGAGKGSRPQESRPRNARPQGSDAKGTAGKKAGLLARIAGLFRKKPPKKG